VTAPPSTYIGRIASVDFQCDSDNSAGNVKLVHDSGFTDLVDGAGNVYLEGTGTTETIIVNCVAVRGDVDCSGSTNSIDAMLVLQLSSRSLDQLECPDSDVNQDGVTDALDATLVLQCGAGLLTSLPS
jgi:hypothetical protein